MVMAANTDPLPQTASLLPLIALLGLLTLGAGFALSVFSKRVV
jgi:LPXTG-motif cell wall-anchored protein